jgi:hypothetical protein
MFILILQLILIGIMLRINCQLHDDRQKLRDARLLASEIISRANFYKDRVDEIYNEIRNI